MRIEESCTTNELICERPFKNNYAWKFRVFCSNWFIVNTSTWGDGMAN